MKLLGKLQKINWGETILIRDYDKFECHVNPYGNSTSGIPSEDHTEIAETIVKAVNNYDELMETINYINSQLDLHIMYNSESAWVDNAKVKIAEVWDKMYNNPPINS